jgi:16S rRNA (cytidine1402-2'-O)-methyltransferase
LGESSSCPTVTHRQSTINHHPSSINHHPSSITHPPLTIKLYLVATPIGNLGDITKRAVEVLQAADVICAEDTRRARILLHHYGIAHKPVSYRDENAERMAPQIARWIAEGKSVALISDAGTPGISDPGFRAVRAVREAGLPVEIIPGATSVTTALLLSGLGVDRFTFEGFLPIRKGRKTRLEELSREPRTMIIFEGPHKLAGTLEDLKSFLGSDRRASVVREMTKIYEEVRGGTLQELADHYATHQVKGEIVVVVEGAEAEAKRLKKEYSNHV